MKIINGDCLEVMKSFEDNSISCIVTDPPYGLKFMGKDWDYEIPGIPFWKEALRVCKPGANLLAFGGTRTYHRLTCAIEGAGWEIRDCIMWVYGSGFPKSHNHFGIKGFGTALKPAYEPIILAMKPCDGTFKQNAEKWGQAGINIDGCRIETSDQYSYPNGAGGNGFHGGVGRPPDGTRIDEVKNNPNCRWPANIIFDEEAGKILDEQSGILKSGEVKEYKRKSNDQYSGSFPDNTSISLANSGGASRFFYCPKASSSERNEGLYEFKLTQQNHHPTVKPLKLMEYLIKLVMPPKDGILLDPFCGSGTTILAAKRLGFEAIGIEKNEEYSRIASGRVENFKVPHRDLDLFDLIEKTS